MAVPATVSMEALLQPTNSIQNSVFRTVFHSHLTDENKMAVPGTEGSWQLPAGPFGLWALF